MLQIKQDQIEVLIANSQKPKALSNFSYPLNSLDDRMFEILTFSIFKKRLANKDKNLKDFDDILLMQGVGEKGMDCVLTKNNKAKALIQCKKYLSNISDTQILNELVKFSLHFYMDKDKFSSHKKFAYYIATSTGYTGKALALPEIITSGNLLTNYDLKTIIAKTLAKYKEFKALKIADVEQSVPNILENLHYEFLNPADYNLWINSFPEIVDTFFEAKKVTDNSLIEKSRREIITKIEDIFPAKEKENIEIFIKKYRAASIEKLNTINFLWALIYINIDNAQPILH